MKHDNMKSEDYGYAGHDSGTRLPAKKPAGYSSPAVHVDLPDKANSVNQKTPAGHKGEG